jgi:hypothetical protein
MNGTHTLGEADTLTASVVPGGGSGTPGGNVVFSIGSFQHTVSLKAKQRLVEGRLAALRPFAIRFLAVRFQ